MEPRRTPSIADPRSFNANTVREVAAVGIIPFGDKHPIGQKINIGGRPFMVTGYATRDEFNQAVKNANLVGWNESWVPHDMFFLRVTMD